jgi:hypothetical protein
MVEVFFALSAEGEIKIFKVKLFFIYTLARECVALQRNVYYFVSSLAIDFKSTFKSSMPVAIQISTLCVLLLHIHEREYISNDNFPFSLVISPSIFWMQHHRQ